MMSKVLTREFGTTKALWQPFFSMQNLRQEGKLSGEVMEINTGAHRQPAANSGARIPIRGQEVLPDLASPFRNKL